MVGGDETAAIYLWYGISASTRASYETCVQAFVAFRQSRGYKGPAMPCQREEMEAWMAEEARRLAGRGGGLGKKALKRKVGALASWHTDLGSETSFLSPRLERVIAGANRYHGVGIREQPLPVTLPILPRLLSARRKRPEAYGGHVDSTGLIAALALMFACFLRMGEARYDDFDPRFDLRSDSVVFHGDECRLTLPASKTDPFRAGVSVAVPTGPEDVCPVRAFKTWLAACPGQGSRPLFTWKGGSFNESVAEAFLRKALLDEGYAAARYTGHSFRRGAATGVPTPGNVWRPAL